MATKTDCSCAETSPFRPSPKMEIISMIELPEIRPPSGFSSLIASFWKAWSTSSVSLKIWWTLSLLVFSLTVSSQSPVISMAPCMSRRNLSSQLGAPSLFFGSPRSGTASCFWPTKKASVVPPGVSDESSISSYEWKNFEWGCYSALFNWKKSSDLDETLTWKGNIDAE